MATGDIIQAEIIGSGTAYKEGWVLRIRIEGFNSTSNVTPVLGYTAGNVPSGTTPYIDVTSQGFNGTTPTTWVRRVYLTKLLRKVTPNEAVQDTAVVGSDLDLFFALSEPVYISDRDANGAVSGGQNGVPTIGSGNNRSGTDPKFTCPDGMVTFGVGGTTFSNAATNLNVTNNSTLTYPKATGAAFLTVPYQTASGETFTVEFYCDHIHARNGRTAAAVEFTATEETSGNTQTSVVTAMSLSATTHNFGGGVVVKVPCYQWSVPLNPGNFTTNRLLTVNAKAYPWIGNESSILDTAVGADGVTQPNAALGPFIFLNDFGNANTVVYATVNASTGNDGTGAVSTTSVGADTNKFATIRAAANAIKTYRNSNGLGNNVNGAVIQVQGSIAWFASSNFDGANFRSWLNVVPHPTNPQSALITSGANITYTGLLRCAVDVNASSTFLFVGPNASTSALWLCCANFASTNLAPFYDYHTIWMTQPLGQSNVTTVTSCSSGFQNFSTSKAAFKLFRGVACPTSVGSTTTAIAGTLYSIVACRNIDAIFQETGNSPSHPISDNFLLLCNYYVPYNFSGTGAWDGLVNASSISKGCAVVNNLMERCGTDQPNLQIAADSSTGTSVVNVVVRYNTFAGARANLFYNDSGSTSRTRRLVAVRANSFRQYNLKTDTFGTPDANRIGNWAPLHGVGYRDNHNENLNFANSASPQLGFDGLGYTSGSGAGYVSDKSLTGTNAGNGDYTPTLTSTLRSRVNKFSANGTTGEAVTIPFDIFGNPRRTDGTGCIGAIEAPSDGVLTAASSNSTGSTVSLDFSFDRSPSALLTGTKTPASITVVGSVSGSRTASGISFGVQTPTTLQVVAVLAKPIIKGETVTVTLTAGAVKDTNLTQQTGAASGFTVTNNVTDWPAGVGHYNLSKVRDVLTRAGTGTGNGKKVLVLWFGDSILSEDRAESLPRGWRNKVAVQHRGWVSHARNTVTNSLLSVNATNPALTPAPTAIVTDTGTTAPFIGTNYFLPGNVVTLSRPSFYIGFNGNISDENNFLWQTFGIAANFAAFAGGNWRGTNTAWRLFLHNDPNNTPQTIRIYVYGGSGSDGFTRNLSGSGVIYQDFTSSRSGDPKIGVWPPAGLTEDTYNSGANVANSQLRIYGVRFESTSFANGVCMCIIANAGWTYFAHTAAFNATPGGVPSGQATGDLAAMTAFLTGVVEGYDEVLVLYQIANIQRSAPGVGNEAYREAVSGTLTSKYKDDAAALRTAVKAIFDGLSKPSTHCFISPYDANFGGINPEYPQVSAKLREIAVANRTDTAFFDMYNAAASNTILLDAGFLNTDGVHPVNAGSDYFMELWYNGVTSSTPEAVTSSTIPDTRLTPIGLGLVPRWPT